MTTCPFCTRDPFEYADIGVGSVPVAVTCCDLGDAFFRGARPELTDDVAMDPDTFNELGQRILSVMEELEAYREKYGPIWVEAETEAQ